MMKCITPDNLVKQKARNQETELGFLNESSSNGTALRLLDDFF